MPKPFHLGWFLQGSSVQAWGESWTGSIGRDWRVPDLFVEMTRALERACFDYVLIEDSSYVGESFGASRDIYLRNALSVPRQDPSVVASILTQATSRIGIVPTFATFAYPPYLLARLVASLDQVSAGRIGWNMVTGSSDVAARNFGLDGLPEHDLRYDMADEYMQVVEALWGSWEPGAIVADEESGVFADPSKVHSIDFEGKVFQVPGAAELGAASAGAAGDRAGRGEPAGAAVRFTARGHDRGGGEGGGRDAGVSGRSAGAGGGARAGPGWGEAAVFGGTADRGDGGGRTGAEEAAGGMGGAADGPAVGAFREDHEHRFFEAGPGCAGGGADARTGISRAWRSS